MALLLDAVISMKRNDGHEGETHCDFKTVIFLAARRDCDHFFFNSIFVPALPSLRGERSTNNGKCSDSDSPQAAGSVRLHRVRLPSKAQGLLCGRQLGQRPGSAQW